MDAIHHLMQNRAMITRVWNSTSSGIESRTTSTNAETAAKIKQHVAEMKALVARGEVIRECDPAFKLLQSMHKDYDFAITDRDDGVDVRMSATNGDECLAQAIQGHAAIVSSFIAEGEAQTKQCRRHAVPQCAVDKGWVSSDTSAVSGAWSTGMALSSVALCWAAMLSALS
mmetsp:Transcript_67143/g.194135  ORF Transcript_67143/g.194135 Transcript_67143/m.194135 type:complete len:171 (+) Transcript_67143:2092-2604(+)